MAQFVRYDPLADKNDEIRGLDESDEEDLDINLLDKKFDNIIRFTCYEPTAEQKQEKENDSHKDNKDNKDIKNDENDENDENNENKQNNKNSESSKYDKENEKNEKNQDNHDKQNTTSSKENNALENNNDDHKTNNTNDTNNANKTTATTTVVAANDNNVYSTINNWQLIDNIIPTYELTKKQASLSNVLKTYRSYKDILKDNIPKYRIFIEQSALASNLNVPKQICHIIAEYCIVLPNISKVNSNIMPLIIDYLKHHNGIIPQEIAKPIRSVRMERIVDDIWDAQFIDSMSKKTIFQIILAANYLDIQYLVHLGSAKIATLIKGKSAEEIKAILADDDDNKDTDETKNNNNNNNNNNDDDDDESGNNGTSKNINGNNDNVGNQVNNNNNSNNTATPYTRLINNSNDRNESNVDLNSNRKTRKRNKKKRNNIRRMNNGNTDMSNTVCCTII